VPARLRWTLGAALLAHAAALAWMGEPRHGPAGTRVPLDAPRAIEVSVLLDEPGPSPAPEPEATRTLEREPRAPGAPAPRVAVRAPVGHATSSLTRERPPGPPDSRPEPSAAGGEWSLSPSGGPGAPTGSLAGPSLDAAVRDGVRATLAEERAARGPDTRAVLPPFGPRDIELGLAPGGALVTIARDVARRSRAPDTSHATLQLDSDAAGVIATARVLEASSGRAEWDEVAAQIAAAARARPPLHVPVGARGLAVTIEMTSRLGDARPAGVLSGALGVVNDPLGLAAREPPRRVVTARMVDVAVF